MVIKGPIRAPIIGTLILGLVLLGAISNTSARPKGLDRVNEWRWELAKASTEAQAPGSCLACHELTSGYSVPRIGATLVGVTNRLPRDTNGLPPRLAGAFVPVPFKVDNQPLLTPEALGHAFGDLIILRY